MSTTVNTGWLKDNYGEKFAPKTLASQVVTPDGKSFVEEIQEQLENVDVGIEITKAEYDALGDVVLTDGKTYFITDIDGGGSGGENANANIIKLTQAEYNALPEEQKANGIYVVTDAEEMTAKNLAFDDSETGLGVNNVQDAIVEQNKNIMKDWTFIKEVTGNTVVNLPNNWRECLLLARYQNTHYWLQHHFFNGLLPVQRTATGFVISASDNMSSVVQREGDTVQLVTFIRNSGDTTSESTVRVYYK